MRIELTERQLLFCQTEAYEVLYGGSAGGGKTFGQLRAAQIYALTYPGSVQVIIRKTYPQLEANIIMSHLELFGNFGGYVYNASKKFGRFANGSVIFFRAMDGPKARQNFQGLNFDVIRVDELTHFTLDEYLYLMSRIRGTKPYPRSIRSSTNPGGVGHEWVKARFIDLCPPDVPVDIPVPGKPGQFYQRIFIPAKLTDNVLLMQNDPDYEARLMLLPETERRQLLYGDWEASGGRFFPEFNESIHVIDEFDIPRRWNRYKVMDYGMDMLACYWIAVDEDGRAYVYRELYEGKDNGMGLNGRGHIASAAARRIHQCSPAEERIEDFIAPPDMRNRQRDSGKSIAEIFDENGEYITRFADNDRKTGWMRVREWLNAVEGEDGSYQPMMKIFRCCQNLIRSMKTLQYDDRSRDCSDTPHELTHAPDAIRYFCSARPLATEKPHEEHRLPFKSLGKTVPDYIGGKDFII